MEDVYSEVDNLMSKLGVNMHKIKSANRKYAFELADVPKEAEYLKLMYPYSSMLHFTPHQITGLMKRRFCPSNGSQWRDFLTCIWDKHRSL